MKTIIAGSRDFKFTAAHTEAIDGLDISEVVCGGARGADEYGRQWAVSRGVPVKLFPADWATHGKAAGPIRNRQMAEYADRLVAFWNGQSRGTKNMIAEASKHGLEVIVLGEGGDQ